MKLNNHYAALPVADVVKHELKLQHKGNTISVSSGMMVVNNTRQSIDTLVFTLNPGLEISAAEVAGSPTPVIRKQQLAILPLNTPLVGNDTLTVDMNYDGTIDEAYCYLDISTEKQREKYGEFVINIDKRYAFITPGYLLLTREAGWYPETGASFSTRNFGWNRVYFTDFSLEVETDTTLQAISQGEIQSPAPAGLFSEMNSLFHKCRWLSGTMCKRNWYLTVWNSGSGILRGMTFSLRLCPKLTIPFHRLSVSGSVIFSVYTT